MKCEKCKTRLITMSGYLFLEADQEPYESGKIEQAHIKEAQVYIVCLYCSTCKKVYSLSQE